MALDADDIGLFLDEDMPGTITDVTWRPARGAVVVLPARFRRTAAPILGGMVTADEPHLIFATSAAPDMTNGDTISIDLTDYTVRDVLPMCDGNLTRALLRVSA